MGLLNILKKKDTPQAASDKEASAPVKETAKETSQNPHDTGGCCGSCGGQGGSL